MILALLKHISFAFLGKEVLFLKKKEENKYFPDPQKYYYLHLKI